MLQVKSAVKEFGNVRAVDGLSFDVREREIFALLGPNGAGKTTLVRMLIGMLKPDRGAIRWSLDGREGTPQAADIGYLPEERGLYKDRPVMSNLTYFGGLRGLSRAQAERSAREWLERLGLADRSHEKIDALSKGNQQKVQFAASILHRPRFAILDEPFSGLDPVNQEAFLDLLQELRDQGLTILLSAHQMELVERLADRILLMNRGRTVLLGSLEDLRDQAQAGQRLLVDVGPGADLAELQSHEAVFEATRDEGRLQILVKPECPLNDLLGHLSRTCTIRSVRSERVSLHDIYVRAVREDSVKEARE